MGDFFSDPLKVAHNVFVTKKVFTFQEAAAEVDKQTAFILSPFVHVTK